MGKGVVADDHPLSVGAARSHALKNADVIFLLGARLNWIMHFGLPPRFDTNVRVIQLDISPEAIGNNVPTEVALVGDGKAIVGQLNTALEAPAVVLSRRHGLARPSPRRSPRTRKPIEPMIDDDAAPMNYYRALQRHPRLGARERHHHRRGRQHDGHRPHAAAQCEPRHRLDAGTYGTMGIGLGFAIAAAVVQPDRPVMSVSGDSAFGFSGMEIETACRYKLPITIVVLNNSGIGGGIEDCPTDRSERRRSTLTRRRPLREA